MNGASSGIAIPVLKKLSEAEFSAMTLADTTDPEIIPPFPPIILATIKELAAIDVFTNESVHPVSAATPACNWLLISPLLPLIV